MADEFGGADPVGDGHVGDPERRFDPAAHRDVAVVTEHLTAVGLGDDRHGDGFQLADRALHIPQPTGQLAAVEHTDVLAEQSDREIDRAAIETVTPSGLRTHRPTHTTIINEGCHSERATSAGSGFRLDCGPNKTRSPRAHHRSTPSSAPSSSTVERRPRWRRHGCRR